MLAVAVSVRSLMQRVVFDRIPGVLRRGPAVPRRIALTFDDGPDELTPRYLDKLDELGVPATFFLLGSRAEARPDLVRAYLRRGHQVASHGYDHTTFTELSWRTLAGHCDRTEQALRGQISGRPWVRPPEGALDAGATVTLLASGYTLALWSVDTRDREDRDPAAIARRCAPTQLVPGDVVRLHEGQVSTLDALARIITPLHAAGYELVTMHDLFAR